MTRTVGAILLLVALDLVLAETSLRVYIEVALDFGHRPGVAVLHGGARRRGNTARSGQSVSHAARTQ